jgi:predicted NAD-dependent protein-ADP-ribosyltransferase YbiA (DUF1768 family)
MQTAGIPTTLCGYGTIIRAWRAPVCDRAGAMYVALMELHEHLQGAYTTEQNMLDTRVRRTSRLLSSLFVTIHEIEQTIETVILPMLVPEAASPPASTSTPTPAPTPEASHTRVYQFFSRSKDCADLGPNIPPTWRKTLSNYCAVRLTVGTRKYHTPEHAFHAEKALCSSQPSMALELSVGGSIGPLPRDAKRAGGKAYYKTHGAVLDQHRWVHKRTIVQQQIIEARLKQHIEFQAILSVVGHRKLHLVHFDRSGGRSFWGASVNAKSGDVQGANRLGLLLMETAARIAHPMTTRD